MCADQFTLPETFAGHLCDDLQVPRDYFYRDIVASIKEQIEDSRRVDYEANLFHSSRQDGQAARAGTGEEDEEEDERFWRRWRKRVKRSHFIRDRPPDLEEPEPLPVHINDDLRILIRVRRALVFRKRTTEGSSHEGTHRLM